MTEQVYSSGERLLVLMPSAKDAERTASFFATAEFPTVICPSFDSLCREIAAGAGAALVTAEVLMKDAAGVLHPILEKEPSWSSFPFIVLVRESSKDRKSVV